MMLTQLLSKLIVRQDLSNEEMSTCIDMLLQENSSLIQKGAVLTAMKSKGETVEEIVACIQSLRKRMSMVNLPDAIDVCGTGGDGSGTFNISTAVGFVVAGAGVPVAKHGNRAASSKCGSADVLEALGVNITISPEQAERVFYKVGMVFLFAPVFHPSFKHLAQVRKELGVPTMFNMIGPFLNPAKVTRQLVGVPNKQIASLLAHVVTRLSYNDIGIVSSEDGLDEVSTNAPTTVFEVKKGDVSSFTILPQKLGFSPSSRHDLLGGSAIENAQSIEAVLQGVSGPKQDIVLLNSGLALYLAGKAHTIEEGIAQAQRSIGSGSALQMLEKLRKETQKYA